MRLAVGEIRKLIKEAFEPKGGWKYFHITQADLGDTATIRPFASKRAQPTWTGNDWVREDQETPRVSLAPSLKMAMRGRYGETTGDDLPHDEMFVYATRSANVIKPTPEQVPDVDLTHELWSLEPVRMTKIGRLFRDKTTGKTRVKWLLKQTTDAEDD